MTEILKQPCVLMYHGVITEWTVLPEERETGAELYDVEFGNFQQQMDCLNAGKYDVSILNSESTGSDGRKIVLTFDDGEMNNYEHVLPVLKKYGFFAYFFIIAKRVGCKGYLGWDELRELHKSGMVIGSHGFSHEILTSLLDTQIEEELCASKKYLERNLEIEVDTLSIPRGFCNDNVIQRAYNAGYKRIFISDRPRKLQSDCYSRIAVKTNWSLMRYKQALDGNMPFIETMAKVSKSIIKRIFGGNIYDWARRTLLNIK